MAKKLTRSNEFWQDLTRIIIEVMPNAESQTVEIVSRIRKEWSGQQVYIASPEEEALRQQREQRNQKLYHEFNGRNMHEVCRKYGLSEMQVYNIINAMHKTKQGDLFE